MIRKVYNSKSLRKGMIVVIASYTISSSFILLQLLQSLWISSYSTVQKEEQQGSTFQSHLIRDEMDDTLNDDKAPLLQLEAKAIRLYDAMQREGIPHAEPPQVHYSFTKFQTSIGQSTLFSYTLTNSFNHTLEWNGGDDYSTYKGSIVCEMERLSSLSMNHIPHFAQVAFPCWSILNQFVAAKRYVEFRNFEWKELTSTWINDLIGIFQDAGIMVIRKNERKNKRKDDGRHLIEWRISINKPSSGGFPRKIGDSKFFVENSKYFLHHSDVKALQKNVLKENYNRDPPYKLPIHVLFIDRSGGTREWVYSHETASQIEKIWKDEISVKVISNFNGTLYDQAMEMHQADIIVSPHGAQLTNLVFIRPCTAVLELFPRSYYLGYFQPLVLSAGGIAFDGYPWDRSPLLDTPDVIGDVKRREWLRKSSLHSSPESIVRFLPHVISNVLSCRRGEKIANRDVQTDISW